MYAIYMVTSTINIPQFVSIYIYTPNMDPMGFKIFPPHSPAAAEAASCRFSGGLGPATGADRCGGEARGQQGVPAMWMGDVLINTHRIHVWYIYANILGILMVHGTIYGIH